MEASLRAITSISPGGCTDFAQASIGVFKRPRGLAFISAAVVKKSTGNLSLQVCDNRLAQMRPRHMHKRAYLSANSSHGSEGVDDNGAAKGPFADYSNCTSGDMSVYRSNGRRRPAGDLPFDVSVVSPPPRYLGRFQLDPHTHCGDILEHEGHHFEVKVVRMRYRLQQGRYQVISKAIEVKSLARKVIEVYLERKFENS